MDPQHAEEGEGTKVDDSSSPSHKKLKRGKGKQSLSPNPKEKEKGKENAAATSNGNGTNNTDTTTNTSTTTTTTTTTPTVPTTNEDEDTSSSKRGKRKRKSTETPSPAKSTKSKSPAKSDESGDNDPIVTDTTDKIDKIEIDTHKTTPTKSTTTTTTTSTPNKADEEEDEKTETWDESDNEEQPPKEPLDLTRPLQTDETYDDKWDSEYVKLPSSAKNVFRKRSNPEKELSRWGLIEQVLQNEISDSSDLEEIIKAYNSKKGFDFSGLHDFFDTECLEDETKLFFNDTLPKLVALALSLPTLVIRPIPLLVKSVDLSIILSQHQIASLLANAFLCTFPPQGGSGDHINVYPSINFNTLFESPCTPKKAAKLKAVIHYFERIMTKMPTGVVSFHRQVLDEFPEWEMSDELLTDLKIEKDGAIEDKGEGLLQVDFANKLIGGGVLGSGSVQEEIRFVLNPELIVSRLFTSKIEDNEVVIIKGAERFSNYKGYSDNFEWVGDHVDNTKRDEIGRLDTTLVAMDAIHLKKSIKQYSPAFLERELNKAYCGFHAPGAAQPLPAVATGNWGCGVFGGDRYLKSILQLMAAATAKRSVVYFTFADEEFADRLAYMFQILQDKKVTVGQLYKAFTEFNALMLEAKSSLEVFDYLEVRFSS